MSDYITKRDVVVAHDQRPTHPAMPDFIWAARQSAGACWQMVNDAATAHENGYEAPDYFENIKRLTDEAKAAEATYQQMYAEWQATL